MDMPTTIAPQDAPASGGDETLGSRENLYSLQVRLLYESAPFIFILPLMLTVITGGVLWNHVPHVQIIAWIAVNWLIKAGQYYLVYKFRTAPSPQENIDVWGRRYLAPPIV